MLPAAGAAGRHAAGSRAKNGWNPANEYSQFIPYGLIRDVQRGEARGPFTVDSSLCRHHRGPTAGAGVRTHLPGLTDAEVFLAKTPRVRQSAGDDRKVYDY